VKKVGAFCWLSLAICIVELLICMKFGHGKLPSFTCQISIKSDIYVKKGYVLQTVCLTFSNLSRAVS
jgi:hypothetical protein